MLPRLLPLGANLTLRRAQKALRAGELDAASSLCRAYLATRIATARLPLTRLDARVASLAALVAVLRGDDQEVKGAAHLVADPGDEETSQASIDVGWCQSALKGKLKTVLEREAHASPIWSELAPLVVLVAAERRQKKTSPALARALRERLATGVGPPEFRARSALMLARMALLDGDRAEATRAFDALPAGDAPRYRALAAMARLDVDAAVEAASGLPPEERRATLELATSLAHGASAEILRRILDACGPQMSAAARATLAATLAVTIAREGSPEEALAILREEQSRGLASTPLAVSTAYVALLQGDATRAREALRGTPRAEPLVSSLALAALAQGGDAAELASELGSLAAAPPERHASVLRPLVLAGLARGGAPPLALPEWLATPPEEPLEVYAWGLVRLQQGQQGAAEEAMAALDAALEAQPDLAALGDAPEVARLSVARSLLQAGEIDRVEALLEKVKSPRLAVTASRLAAIALVKRRAGERGVVLRPETLPAFVDELRRGARPGSDEIAALEVARSDLQLWRVRNLLGEGKTAEARAALDALGENRDPDVAVLRAAADVCGGRVPLSEVEATLGRDAEAAPGHAALQVLLAEVASATRGGGAGIALLEAARAKVESPLVERALASTYHAAHRGLEAKRVGFAAARRSRGAASGALREELSRVLSFEVPPPRIRVPAGASGKVTRTPLRDPLSPAGLSRRVDVLFAHAAAACAEDPQVWPTIEAAMQRLKRSLMTDDEADALAAEREIVNHVMKART